jgi:hypothetical protein
MRLVEHMDTSRVGYCSAFSPIGLQLPPIDAHCPFGPANKSRSHPLSKTNFASSFENTCEVPQYLVDSLFFRFTTSPEKRMTTSYLEAQGVRGRAGSAPSRGLIKFLELRQLRRFATGRCYLRLIQKPTAVKITHPINPMTQIRNCCSPIEIERLP